MTGLLEFANSRIATIEGYRPGRSAGRAERKLSSNESPFGPSAAVRGAIAAAADSAHRYPEAAELRQLVAATSRVAPEQVVLGNGSDELCYLIATLFIEPGASVVLSDPCYRIDEIVTRLHGGDPVFVPLHDGVHDLDAMAAAADGAALVWLPTPHNPTGRAVAPDAVAEFLASVPAHCLVVLDEAYRPYADPHLRPDVTALLERHPNLVVQRTFSKVYALAGLRIGYALAAPEVATALERIRPPFNVNVAGVAGARAALADDAWSDYVVELVRRERSKLEELLEELGWEHHASQANFVTFRPPDSGLLFSAFDTAGIAVRDGSDLGIAGWLRVSIGSPAQMAIVRGTILGQREEAA
jgi:histidinol-phosphate aminotransferase